MEAETINKIVSLCKRRGFVFQSSEIYGGLRSCYDYGPLGVELKRNLASEWWQRMVYERDDIYGLDASIIMHPKVWQASGHLDNFADPLVDCRLCKERFRADKAPQLEPGSETTFRREGKTIKGTVAACGYVCPKCGSPDLSPERQFMGMFRSHLGPVDPWGELADKIRDESVSREELASQLGDMVRENAIYLRPETAQAMFVQFANIVQTTSARVPFGIAQIGKSFRNEIIVEHFIFRSCEFEQMEMEFFCTPGTQEKWLDYWCEERLGWYRQFANNPDDFRLRAHSEKELAHYSDACFDVEYRYPWGWDELEGIASRTDYDLQRHAQASGSKLSYLDTQATDPETGKSPWRYTPYVIEPAAGLTRGVLALLCDAYTEEEGVDAKGQKKTRTVLKLHPRLAPIKAAVLPLVRKDGQPEKGHEIARGLRQQGIMARYDETGSIGKRYAKHDEVGTPFCLTVDNQTLEDNTVTIRDRDSTEQQRIPVTEVAKIVQAKVDS